MIPPRSTLTRLLATLTPALLLWAFVGCVAVCAEHAEEGLSEDVAASSVELGDSHCSDPCPVTDASFTVPAKRFAPDQQAVAAQPVTPPAAQEPPRAAPIAGRFSEVLRPPPDPPFERLRALRI
jgi:hypothetical protein